jgi:dTDP-4-amino-4,6-dideoxygalactose transaminase
MIPSNDFRRQWEDIRADVIAALERVGGSGWYVLGDQVRIFESVLASRWGFRYAAGVACGLDAIEIALRILGCGPGDRVLTTPLSAFATTLAIVRLGAIPVFVDTDENGLVDLARCRSVLEQRKDIRFFVPVHLYGQPLDSAELRRLRADFDLKMVEDCAQSVCARFREEPTGLAGQAAATSFYPTKNLGGMGDGGAILTNDAAVDEQARVLRSYGETARYQHQRIGYNSRLDELQASILLRAVLPRLDTWIKRRREIAASYCQGIRHAAIRLLSFPGEAEPNWHLFPVFVPPASRDGFLAHLQASGIGAGVHYPLAIPDQAALKRTPYELAGDCVRARRQCSSEVSLPIHPYLTDEEVLQIINAVNGWQAAAESCV